MTKKELKSLLEKGESLNLDWKKNFPPGILRGRNSPDWDKGRGKLLKALISLANSSGSSPAFLIYGVKDMGSKREVFGISKSFDDADFQQWAKNTFDPPPNFLYTEIEWTDKMRIGVFRIEKNPDYPHVVKIDLGGILYQGQVWHRKGSQNDIALHSDLRDMFKGENPFKVSNLNDPELDKVKDYYTSKGREVSLPLLQDKDSRLAQGYEIAVYPGTRREIWAGASGNRYQHILLLKPKKSS